MQMVSQMASTVRHSAAFLVQDSARNSGQPTPVATCFFVFKEPNQSEVYIVTARHNLEYADKSKPLFVRLNNDSSFVDLEVPHINDWVTHPLTDVAILDVAILKFQLPENSNVFAIPSGWLIGRERLEKYRPMEGVDVCFAALFDQTPGVQRIQPIIRFGKISLAPHEPILAEIGPQNRAQIHAYLVECLSWGGCSGAPVFIDYPDYSRIAKSEGELAYCMPIGLLGLISSHYDINRKLDGSGLTSAHNSGIAVVIPALGIEQVLSIAYDNGARS